MPGPHRIQKDDQLSIFISCSDPVDATIFNQPNFSLPSLQGGTTGSTVNNPVLGYLVDKDGYLFFPKIGKIKVLGFTKAELRDTLQKRLLMYIKDPQVSIRLINYRVTIIGEVARPGIYNITNDNVTLLEALGMAGDLTIYGRRDNVLLIRQNDSINLVHYLNMQDKNILQSEYFNLQPGDIVYVTPNKVRANSTDEFLQLLPIGLSILSTLIIFMSYILPRL